MTEPMLRDATAATLRELDADALRAALRDALAYYAAPRRNHDRLYPIGLKLTIAGRHESAREALDWAGDSPCALHLNALGTLLSAMWDPQQSDTRVDGADVARLIALREVLRPDPAPDHALLMALAAAAGDPAQRPLVLPVLRHALTNLEDPDAAPNRLLAAAVETYSKL
jgi:hypothetical protein